ncbi:MAG TPA: isocitrate lyase/phosphoenolpyruvate mutase family protein [Streptosporangiaceae bacterium]|jgi:2-methylisocitrate lyase-like PEP mutase family enzyme
MSTPEPAAGLHAKAARLRELHQPGTPLLLPNAWDVSSAKLVAERFPAVATTSGGVARSLGFEDHQAAPSAAMLGAAARVAAAVDVPVTVDAEAGYGLAPGELTGQLLAAGVAGCNLEDTDYSRGGLTDVRAQCDFLAAVVEAAAQAGIPLVVNARVDVFLQAGGRDESPAVVDEAIARGRRYLAAGADCVYPILASGDEVIGQLAAALDGRVNVLLRAGVPSLARLAQLGVARVSLGAGLHTAMCSWLGDTLDELSAGRPPF